MDIVLSLKKNPCKSIQCPPQPSPVNCQGLISQSADRNVKQMQNKYILAVFVMYPVICS